MASAAAVTFPTESVVFISINCLKISRASWFAAVGAAVDEAVLFCARAVVAHRNSVKAQTQTNTIILTAFPKDFVM
jgi:hypothetical protein